MVDDSFAHIICYLCPQIKIDDLFNAVGACAECSVDYDMQYSGGYQILEILKFVENDLLIETARLNENARRNENAHLIEIEAFPGILIENNTTTLAVPEVNDLTNLQRIAIRTMQLSLRGDNVRMIYISIYLPILHASLRDDWNSSSVITLSSEELCEALVFFFRYELTIDHTFCVEDWQV